MNQEINELKELTHALADLALNAQCQLTAQHALLASLIGTIHSIRPDEIAVIRANLLQAAPHYRKDAPIERQELFQTLIAEQLRNLDSLLAQ